MLFTIHHELMSYQELTDKIGIPNGLVPLLWLSKFYSIKHLVSYHTPYVKCALFSRPTHLGHRVPKRYSKV